LRIASVALAHVVCAGEGAVECQAISASDSRTRLVNWGNTTLFDLLAGRVRRRWARRSGRSTFRDRRFSKPWRGGGVACVKGRAFACSGGALASQRASEVGSSSCYAAPDPGMIESPQKNSNGSTKMAFEIHACRVRRNRQRQFPFEEVPRYLLRDRYGYSGMNSPHCCLEGGRDDGGADQDQRVEGEPHRA
jgi:hypothetical protein